MGTGTGPPGGLSYSTMISYSCLRTVISSFDLTLRPSRTFVWIDRMGMPVGLQASLVAVCKSVDLFSGFVIGKASDNTRTKWGRRKPFIAILFPLCGAPPT